MIVQIAHPTTSDTGLGYLVVDLGFGYTSPESMRRGIGCEESDGRCGFVE